MTDLTHETGPGDVLKAIEWEFRSGSHHKLGGVEVPLTGCEVLYLPHGSQVAGLSEVISIRDDGLTVRYQSREKPSGRVLLSWVNTKRPLPAIQASVADAEPIGEFLWRVRLVV